MAYLHKTALLIHKMLILCLLESKSQVSKTVFILKFGPPVTRINKLSEFYLIYIN